MAVPGGTFKSYEAVGNRESLSDVIYDISPTDRPFTVNIDKETSQATKEEWQTDALDAATANNAHAEGDDSATNTATPTVRYANYHQLHKKVARVSGTQRVVRSAGRADDLDYQVMKRALEIANDIEKAALSEHAATAGAAGSAALLAGVGPWLWDESAGGNGIPLDGGWSTVAVTSGAPATDVTTSAVASAISEGRFKSAVALTWDDGGEPSIILVNSALKQKISLFTGIATQYKENDMGPAAIIGAADYYVSEFGTHYIVADRFMPANTVYLIDPEYWCLSYLREFEETPLAKTGDSDRVQVLSEVTLICKNPKASGKIYGAS